MDYFVTTHEVNVCKAYKNYIVGNISVTKQHENKNFYHITESDNSKKLLPMF